MTRRIIRRKRLADASSLPASLHPVLLRVLAARAVNSVDDLEYTLDRLLPPGTLGGLDEAAVLLETVARSSGRIVVVGDFDADGATSVALCLRALRMMGIENVRYLVPNRFEYGYGLTPEIVAVAVELDPQLIITVDNGISSVAGVAAAKQLGIQVLVTDHHLPGEQLPMADVIVNPNRKNDTFPSKCLAGVGVAFYVLLALRTRLREQGWFRERNMEAPKLARLLDLVALGTVADVVPLDHNNRILVQQGIQRIRAGHCVPGIRALLDAGARNPARIVASDLGFVVGPRLNAAGRMDDMSIGIECLLTDDAAQATELAAQLDAMNRSRREVEADMQAQALTVIREMKLDAEQLPVGLCLFQPDWHQGVIGILASRIKDRYHRPVIAFARSSEAGMLKGSARSVSGLHIRDALDAVATRHPGLLGNFGGHAMAAGLSLTEASFPAFAQAFDEEISRHLTREDLAGVVYSDGELSESELSLETAQLLRDASPWGQGFPEPLFEGNFEVLNHRIVGQRHMKMLLRPLGGGHEIDAIAFNTPELPEPCRQLHMAYRLDVNEFRGRSSAQLIVECIAPPRVVAPA